MDRNLVVALSRLPRVDVQGDFWRHASRREHLTSGSRSGGRWSPSDAFPVIYLGRPPESVIAEAHRNLVEAVEGMTPDMVAPRICGRLRLSVHEVLDLRDSETQLALGLDGMFFEGPWPACQALGQAAHQLGVHGILAPAATHIGETLSLFERHLSADEFPILVEVEAWDSLPADPRKPRVLDLESPKQQHE